MSEESGVCEDDEFAFGALKGDMVIFKRRFKGYRFTDDDVRRLLRGETIEIRDLISKSGRHYGIRGKLEKQPVACLEDEVMVWAEFIGELIENDEPCMVGKGRRKEKSSFNGDGTTARKRRKRAYLIAAALLVIFILCAIFIRTSDDGADDGIGFIADDEQRESDPAQARIHINSKMLLKDDGSLLTGFKNMPENALSQKLRLYQGDEMIYESPELNPGYELNAAYIGDVSEGAAEAEIIPMIDGKEAGNIIRFEIKIVRSMID